MHGLNMTHSRCFIVLQLFLMNSCTDAKATMSLFYNLGQSKHEMR